MLEDLLQIYTRGIICRRWNSKSKMKLTLLPLPHWEMLQDFGDLIRSKKKSCWCNDLLQDGVFAGGDAGPTTDTIDFITIATTGNATDFGNLS